MGKDRGRTKQWLYIECEWWNLLARLTGAVFSLFLSPCELVDEDSS